MENLTLLELRFLESWALFSLDENTKTYPGEYNLLVKIRQAIADLEFEEKHPKYLS